MWAAAPPRPPQSLLPAATPPPATPSTHKSVLHNADQLRQHSQATHQKSQHQQHHIALRRAAVCVPGEDLYMLLNAIVLGLWVLDGGGGVGVGIPALWIGCHDVHDKFLEGCWNTRWIRFSSSLSTPTAMCMLLVHVVCERR